MSEPALTPEEWQLGLQRLDVGVPSSPGYHEIEWLQDEIDAAEAVIRWLRNFHGQPFGFTWEDVDRINSAANDLEVGRSDHPSWDEYIGGLRLVADRIAALLPPRENP